MSQGIKEGDKLTLITRRDISPGYQAVQSAHASHVFAMEHPAVFQDWYKNSNYLCMLSVESEYQLQCLTEKALDLGIKFSVFREPDIGDQVTAVALEPSVKTKKLCGRLPLALK